MPDFISIENLSKRYGTGAFVVKGFSKKIDRGSVIGLTGSNGSGKTTFLRLLTTAAFPTEGRIMYQDYNIHEQPRTFLQHVGQATDVSNLPEYLNAEEILEWILRARNKWNAASTTRISDLLDVLELDERRKEIVGTYSSGMMQKTLIASALIAEPDIIVLDEPFRALDVSSREKSITLLQQFSANGGTIFISSHHKGSLDLLCTEYITFPLQDEKMS